MEKLFFEFYGEDDIKRLEAFAEKVAKGGKLRKVETYVSKNNFDCIYISYDSQSEKQKQYGYYTTHCRHFVISRIPKKYQPSVWLTR